MAGGLRTELHPLEIRRFGVVSYAEGLALQKALVEARRRDEVPDQLLLLEHPHVITLGVKTRGARDHVVATPERLRELGVEVHDTGRGGDVTYHGPGQLVAYPIVNLHPDRRDVHKYVRDLEQVLIDVAASYGIEAARQPGLTGVWVGDRKLAAIGVRISRWVTSHGIALNVTTNLDYFSLIVPCGIRDRGVTSIEALLGRPVPMDEVADRFAEQFCRTFERVPVGVPA